MWKTGTAIWGSWTQKEKSIGVYNLKRAAPYGTAIGGRQEHSYGVKHVSVLVHWDRSLRGTERAAAALFGELENVRDVIVNGKRILFTMMLTGEPVDVGRMVRVYMRW